MNIREEYFEWIYQRIDGKGYRSLLETLYNTEFVYSMTMDENRLKDGIDLRCEFARECRIPQIAIKLKMDNTSCSVLEVMVALAIRMETTIFDDPDKGDRTYVWFWDMVKALGLYHMDDDNFDYDETEEIIERFLKRQYDYDGRGSLFYIPEAESDMRDLEIWYQMCMYSDMILDL